MPDVPAGFVADEEETPEGFVADETKPVELPSAFPKLSPLELEKYKAGAINPITGERQTLMGALTTSPLSLVPPVRAEEPVTTGVLTGLQPFTGLPPDLMAAAVNEAKGLGEFITSPLGKITSVGAVSSPVIRRGLALLFGGQLALGAKEKIANANTPQDIIEGLIEGAGAGAVGLGVLPGRKPASPEFTGPLATGEALPTPRGSPPVRRPPFQLPDAAEQISTKPVEPEAPPAAPTGGALLRTAPEGKAEPVEALKPTTEPSAISQAKPEEQVLQERVVPEPAAETAGGKAESTMGVPPRVLPGAGINSKDVARQYGMPEDFYGTADEQGQVSSKYRTKEYDDAVEAERRVQKLQGINATTIRRQARQRTEKAFLDLVHKARISTGVRPAGMAEPEQELVPSVQGLTHKRQTEVERQPTPTPVETPTPPAAEVGKGEVKPEALAQDWTTATQEQELGAGIPIPKFADVKMSPLDKATTSHSAKVQTSFDEARRAQRDIAKVAPKPNRQSAISVWLEAKGDLPTLQNWATLAKGKLFKQAAIDAQTLTPLEIAIANKVRVTFDTLYNRGQTYDVLNSHRDNYVTHIWDVQNPSQTKGLGLSSKRLKENFKWAKARTFENFFEGDQAGFVPRTLEIGKILPAYLHEMNQVIADRQFIKDIAKTPASDTRPLAVPRGRGQVVEGDEGKAYLIFPHAQRTAKDASGAKIDQSDYRIMEGQPALNAWRWMEKDEQGNPIFLKGDLALHPEAYRRINAMIGQSELKRWMQEPVSGVSQVPRAVLRGLDRAQSEMKGMMFGLLAPFHQVQEGTHAIGHIVNPFFGLERVDMRKPKMVDAARHGLMILPDRSSAGQYLEGSGASRSLLTKGLRKIPKAGEALADVIDGYQDYLFHQYIPALKYKTYEALLSRNMKLYSGEISAGTMTPADVKLTSAQQANAAYGHLNYALLDRNPTIQHLMRLTLLAPDFLEARSRFVGQAVKGMNSKVGHEQFKAVAVLAAVQAGAAYVLSKLLPDSHWDPEHPFELVHKNRRYLMRSVPEDLFRFGEDIASALTGSDRGMPFIMARVNPLVTRGAIQGLTGLNYRGEKVTLKDTLEELMAGYIPITARWIPGLRQLTQTGRQSPVSPLQELSGSLGLRVSRYSPISETYKTAAKWMDKQGMERPKGSYPVSQYQQLRYALEDGDLNKAREEYLKLKQTQPNLKKLRLGFRQSIFHPFTQSQAIDKKFSKTLTGYDKELYDLAVQIRKNIARSFDKVVRETESKTPTWDETEPAGFQPE